jgi:hypothetical protein
MASAPRNPAQAPPIPAPASPHKMATPAFAQPVPTEDPNTFRIRHASDKLAYQEIDALNKKYGKKPLPFPPPRGLPEPRLTLEDVLGGNNEAAQAIQNILKNKQIVFHAGGDCGNTRGPEKQNEVTDKLVSDFDESRQADIPQFALLLGDIVYSFGEAQYYYDQFYEPYRDYPAPILAVAGNHDGMIAPDKHVASLDAFQRNFCATSFEITPDAGGLSRTAQIQPGVFYTFDAPFVRIIALYSNMLEDPGYIADIPSKITTIGNSQIAFLKAALTRVKTENFKGALLFAHHHPPYTPSNAGSHHGGSPDMLKQIDDICASVGVWPHAVLSGHVHNYQRFTRTRSDGTEIPYVSDGNMGHNVQRLARNGAAAIRTPAVMQEAGANSDQVVFNRYDDINYGYLRVIVTSNQLRIEYHSASDGPNVKTPDDAVTVDLATHKLVQFTATNTDHPKAGRKIRKLQDAQT